MRRCWPCRKPSLRHKGRHHGLPHSSGRGACLIGRAPLICRPAPPSGGFCALPSPIFVYFPGIRPFVPLARQGRLCRKRGKTGFIRCAPALLEGENSEGFWALRQMGEIQFRRACAFGSVGGKKRTRNSEGFWALRRMGENPIKPQGAAARAFRQGKPPARNGEARNPWLLWILCPGPPSPFAPLARRGRPCSKRGKTGFIRRASALLEGENSGDGFAVDAGNSVPAGLRLWVGWGEEKNAKQRRRLCGRWGKIRSSSGDSGLVSAGKEASKNGQEILSVL